MWKDKGMRKWRRRMKIMTHNYDGHDHHDHYSHDDHHHEHHDHHYPDSHETSRVAFRLLTVPAMFDARQW